MDSWRDTSRWDIPEFEVDQKKEKDFFGGVITPKMRKEWAHSHYVSQRISDYKPPVKSKFFQKENIDEISNALMAAKEGKIDYYELSNIVYKNIPLPPESAHGSGMAGDVYTGTVKDNILSILGFYLDGELQSYNPIKKKLDYYPEKEISELPPIVNDGSKFGAYGLKWGNYIKSGFMTEKEAIDWWVKTNSGGPVMMETGPEPGSNYYIRFPETYDKLIEKFRANPAKLLADTIKIIAERNDEDKAGFEIFMSFYGPDGSENPRVIAKKHAEGVKKLRDSFSIVKTEEG